MSYALWGLCKVVELSIVGAIIYRRQWKTWKWLGWYCVARVAVDAVLFTLLIIGNHRWYFRLFWAAEPGFVLLQAGILATVYSVAIESFKVESKQMRLTIIAIYFIVGGAFGAAFADGGASWASVEKIALAGNRVLAVLFAVTLVLTIGYSTAIGLKWTGQVLLIDAGLILGTVVSAGWYALHWLHPHANPALRDMASRVAHLTTICIWLTAFIVPRNRGTANLEVRSQLARLIDRLSDTHKERNVVGTTV